MLEHFTRLLRYETWANGRAIDSLRSAEGAAGGPDRRAPFDRARGIFAHMQGARRIWLVRLGGATMPEYSGMFPDWPIDRCAAEAAENDALWGAHLSRLAETDLARAIAFKNMKGEAHTRILADILTHVFNHSTYHRGQIAMLVRQAGGAPAETDFTLFAGAPARA